MLKKVLKQYCAPIPEESEELSPALDKGLNVGKTDPVTAQVIVAVEERQPPLLKDVHFTRQQELSGQAAREESSGSVSPFTSK